MTTGEVGSLIEKILSHHGVKGQKWGFRNARRRTPKAHAEAGGKNKHPGHLSDDDLQALVNRMQLEKRYLELSKKPQSKGAKFAESLLQDVGKELFKVVVKETATKKLRTSLNASSSSSGASVAKKVVKKHGHTSVKNLPIHDKYKLTF